MVEHLLHNIEVVVYYEIMSSYMPLYRYEGRLVGITPVIQTSECAMVDNWTVSMPGEFFSLGMILK